MPSSPLTPLAIAVVALCLATGTAAADPGERGRWYLAGNAPIKWDGHGGDTTDRNPLTNRLYYLPLTLELGYRLTPTFGVHASLGYGPIIGAETSGTVVEAMVGLDALIPLGQRFRFGVRLDAGYTSLSYSFHDDPASLSAVVLEPKAAIEVDLDRDWALGLYVGPRWKWLRDAAQRGPQTGWSASVSLMRSF